MVNLFLDTDFGPDCDDAGALEILHRLCDRGEARLLGVTHCTSNPYGLPAISAFNRFHGREVPLGTTVRPGFLAEHLKYNRVVAEQYPNGFADGRKQPEARETFREVLSAQPDGSVTVCAIGPMNNLADYLADDTCRELIGRKVCRLVAMAGRFDERRSEWNVEMDVSAARRVIGEWPGEIALCPWECGEPVLTGRSLAGQAEERPVACAYERWTEGRMLRSSYDLLAVWYAVRGGAGLMADSPRGRIEVSGDGVTLLHPDRNGRHWYTVNAAPAEEIAGALEALLAGEPEEIGTHQN